MSKLKDSLSRMPKPVKIVLWVLLALFAYALPLLEPPFITTPGVDFGGVLFIVTMYMLVALGLNIVVGYAGLLDLGYVGFYAIGAYTAAILTSYHAHWPLLLAIPAAVVATTISGVMLGAPTLRVRGDYLAIVTLGFGEIIRLVAVNTEWLGDAKGISNIARPPSLGGTEGLFEVPHLYWGDGTVLLDTQDTTKFLVFGVLDQIPYYWMGLTVVIVVLFADYLIKNSRVGRAWEATREDEDAAELMGVPTFRFKLLAFATGAFIGGLAGSLYASRQSFINPASFLLLFSILFLAAVVVGGQGNRWGVLVGAALVAYLPQRFREFDDFRVLVFGLALVLLAVLRPEGLFPPKRTVRAKQLEHELDELEEGTEGEEGARV
ncbi:branched-chain amino acid ABC transporter permease [Nocardioides sp. zg-1228]|uniref:branched-chain amino acid ABC transporter permease n=1 Tax=Nocardioides sp. zg-1228 TaxID=2763008 RepID=UPI001642E25D|nr:branched-chain amino acid ABC transporter permease [Nocardioides sp. zg-1228]MBC2934417.1 branched-chain amino acid ABC transporter permease [Nocardioides sp. zg-1228]